jgi:hypothetical protein
VIYPEKRNLFLVVESIRMKNIENELWVMQLNGSLVSRYNNVQGSVKERFMANNYSKNKMHSMCMGCERERECVFHQNRMIIAHM